MGLGRVGLSCWALKRVVLYVCLGPDVGCGIGCPMKECHLFSRALGESCNVSHFCRVLSLYMMGLQKVSEQLLPSVVIKSKYNAGSQVSLVRIVNPHGRSRPTLSRPGDLGGWHYVRWKLQKAVRPQGCWSW